jgi:hypothetical protein
MCGKSNPYILLVGYKLVQPLWRFLRKLPYEPVTLILSIYVKCCTSAYNRDACMPMLIAAVFTTDNCEVI